VLPEEFESLESAAPRVYLPSSGTLQSSIIQRKAPLTAIRIVTPPIRHEHDLARSEEQEDEQHAEVEAGVESRSQDVIPAIPQSVAVAVSPKHDHEAADQTAQVAGTDVSIELRHRAEEDGRVPQLEFGAREEAVERVDQDWGGGT
jgi:hypothetical protein